MTDQNEKESRNKTKRGGGGENGRKEVRKQRDDADGKMGRRGEGGWKTRKEMRMRLGGENEEERRKVEIR